MLSVVAPFYLIPNIRIASKLSKTNALAYFEVAQVTKKRKVL